MAVTVDEDHWLPRELLTHRVTEGQEDGSPGRTSPQNLVIVSKAGSDMASSSASGRLQSRPSAGTVCRPARSWPRVDHAGALHASSKGGVRTGTSVASCR
jgi:hypothetical protein